VSALWLPGVHVKGHGCVKGTSVEEANQEHTCLDQSGDPISLSNMNFLPGEREEFLTYGGVYR